MGCWGMGITQSDEYCEIYDRFMAEYDEGKALCDIKQDILDEYLEQFDESDGILHDVYFAIGKAEWMCGGISDDIFQKISHIIQSGENIAFLRELEASERDLKQRQKNLEKFLTSLSVPRGKTKKRKRPTERSVKGEKPELPPFAGGDVFAYEVNDAYRLLCLINRGIFLFDHLSFCYVWTNLYKQVPTIEELTKEPIMPLGYFKAGAFPDIKKMIYVGNYPDMLKLDCKMPSKINVQWKPADWAIAKEAHLSETYPLDLSMELKDCLTKANDVERRLSFDSLEIIDQLSK